MQGQNIMIHEPETRLSKRDNYHDSSEVTVKSLYHTIPRWNAQGLTLQPFVSSPWYREYTQDVRDLESRSTGSEGSDRDFFLRMGPEKWNFEHTSAVVKKKVMKIRSRPFKHPQHWCFTPYVRSTLTIFGEKNDAGFSICDPGPVPEAWCEAEKTSALHLGFDQNMMVFTIKKWWVKEETEERYCKP